MTRSMKLLAALALATAVTAPAFAQQAPHSRRDAAAAYQQHQQWDRQGSNANTNPDFQLGGDR
jgi:hypothetical protein